MEARNLDAVQQAASREPSAGGDGACPKPAPESQSEATAVALERDAPPAVLIETLRAIYSPGCDISYLQSRGWTRTRCSYSVEEKPWGPRWYHPKDGNIQRKAIEAIGIEAKAILGGMCENPTFAEASPSAPAERVSGFFPITPEAVSLEEARQEGERDVENLLEAFLDRCEGFLDTEGMASNNDEIAEVIGRFIDEAREDLRVRRGGNLPSAEELLAKMLPAPPARQ